MGCGAVDCDVWLHQLGTLDDALRMDKFKKTSSN